MALIDKIKAIADGFRASRVTEQEYSLDEMAVLAAEEVGGGSGGSGGSGGPFCVVSVAEDSANVVENVVNIATVVSVDSETLTGMRLNYIKSTGTQYFDTGVVPDATTEIEMRYSVQNILEFGCHMLSSKQCFFPLPRSFNNKRCFFAHRFGNEIEVGYTPLVNTIYTVKAFPSDKIVISGTEYATLVSGSTVDTSTLYMNTYGGAPGNTNYTGSATIYYCKIWKNGVLVRDFIPYESFTDGVGMMDLVENKLYTSAGTGQFAAGPYAL